MSIELATDTLGSAITAASSYDFKHPPSQIIDGKPNTYWLSTGLYPQEFILQLGEPSIIKNISIVSSGLRNVEIYKSDTTHVSSWDIIGSLQADDADGDIQRFPFQIPPRLTATFIRVKIKSGWTDFIQVHHFSVLGSPANDPRK